MSVRESSAILCVFYPRWCSRAFLITRPEATSESTTSTWATASSWSSAHVSPASRPFYPSVMRTSAAAAALFTLPVSLNTQLILSLLRTGALTLRHRLWEEENGKKKPYRFLFTHTSICIPRRMYTVCVCVDVYILYVRRERKRGIEGRKEKESRPQTAWRQRILIYLSYLPLPQSFPVTSSPGFDLILSIHPLCLSLSVSLSLLSQSGLQPLCRHRVATQAPDEIIWCSPFKGYVSRYGAK